MTPHLSLLHNFRQDFFRDDADDAAAAAAAAAAADDFYYYYYNNTISLIFKNLFLGVPFWGSRRPKLWGGQKWGFGGSYEVRFGPSGFFDPGEKFGVDSGGDDADFDSDFDT